MILCTAATFGVSLYTYRWIEKPFIHWAAARTRTRPIPDAIGLGRLSVSRNSP